MMIPVYRGVKFFNFGGGDWVWVGGIAGGALGVPLPSPPKNSAFLARRGGRGWGLAAQHMRCGGRGGALLPGLRGMGDGAKPHHLAHTAQGKGQGLATQPT